MIAEAYSYALREVLETIFDSQMEPIRQAAERIAQALAEGGALHLFDTGHMLNHEAVGRSGGMMAITPLQVSLEVTHPARPRAGRAKPRAFMDEIQGLAEYVVGKSAMYEGDVLLLGSVSGMNPLPVEIARQAQAAGITVIAITSVPYSRTLSSAHPSGLRLFEAADMVLDIGGVPGDAAVTIPGLEAPFGPTSGIAASYINWLLQGAIIEALLCRGLTPSVYLSNHMPGAGAFNARMKQQYAEKGY